MKKAFLYLLIIMCLILKFDVIAQNGCEALLVPLSLEQKVANTSLIVEAEVVAKESFWDNNRHNIYTKFTLQPFKLFKGSATSQIQVIVKGGTVGDRMHIFSDQPDFRVGDMGTFFLYPNNNHRISISNAYKLYGAVQGAIVYDLTDKTAHTPFRKYSTIQQELYGELQTQVSRQVRILRPNIRLEAENNGRNPMANPSNISFSPSNITAGTFAELTINGSNFGNSQGTVEFKDANYGGSLWYSTVQDEIISWSDTEIVTRVPWRAGTGQIRVKNSANQSGTSASSLTIDYSQINISSTTTAYQPFHMEDNGNGGFTFKYEETFNDHASATARFSEAYDYWKCESGLNFLFDGTTNLTVSADDGINIVRFDNAADPLPAGVLGQVANRFINSTCNGKIPIKEIDMTWDDGSNLPIGEFTYSWYYGTGDPNLLQFDFKSMVLHELGHTLLLGHVIDPNKVMHYSLTNGTNKFNLSQDDINGANYVMDLDEAGPYCGIDTMNREGPEITSQPTEEVKGCINEDVFIPIVAPEGATYQWQQYNSSTSTWNDITSNIFYFNQNTATLKIRWNQPLSGMVRCRVANNCGNETVSDPIDYAIQYRPSFTTQPNATSYVCENGNITITVAANNTDSYQWQSDESGSWADLSNNSNYNGVATATLAIISVPVSLDGTQYRCVATGGCSKNSNTTTLTLLPATSCGDEIDYFITTWETTTANEEVVIGTNLLFTDYDFTVDWGDGAVTDHTGDATHTYASPGIHTVKIIGTYPSFTMDYTSDYFAGEKLRTVEQWGTQQWQSFYGFSKRCPNLTLDTDDLPDLSQVTNMINAFQNTTNDLGNIAVWDVGNVLYMDGMFAGSTYNGNLSSWDVSNVRRFKSMFSGNADFDQDLGSWDIGSVTSMESMFLNAGLSTANYDATLIGWATDGNGVAGDGIDDIPYNVTFDGGSSVYCTGRAARELLTDTYGWTITDGGLDLACSDASEFFVTTWQTTTNNESITIPTTGTGYDYYVDWGDGSDSSHSDGDPTTDATHTYATAGTYTIKIAGDFPRIYFNDTGDKNKILTVEQWGVIEWNSFSNAFQGCSNIVINAVDNPDLSDVTNFDRIFQYTSNLSGNLSGWDTTSITNMTGAFAESGFNGDISSWNTSNVTTFDLMFFYNANFNQDISGWDTSSATSMEGMFSGTQFNQDIGNWDVSNVTDFSYMFYSAQAFNQDLGNWDISSATNMASMLQAQSYTTENYDSTLIGWATLDTVSGETQIPTVSEFDAGVTKFCAAASHRQLLIDTYGWTIYDGGVSTSCYDEADFFITTWQTTTDNESITIPTTGTGYEYYVDWGDGAVTAHSDTDATTDATHTYAVAGTYMVKLIGDFPRIYFNNTGDQNKILSVEQWGSIEWVSFSSAFMGCFNLVINATDSPNLSNLVNIDRMFNFCPNLSGNLSGWDTSNITSMQMVFAESGFNGDISSWETGSVTHFVWMFFSCDNFNQDISNWDTSSATSMEGMFAETQQFNQDIGNWEVSNVTNFSNMFLNADAFNQNLGDWDISSATNMANMLESPSFSTDNYDSTLIGWATDSSGTPGDGIDDIPTNITFGGGNSTYCTAMIERDELINTYGWTIADGGVSSISCLPAEDLFITTWQTTTDNETITIPTNGTGYNYMVDWGDGSESSHSDADPIADATHTYATAGTYTVKIAGLFPRIDFFLHPDSEKILSVEQWGKISWNSFEHAFMGCQNLVINATDAPDLSLVTTTRLAFGNCSNLTGDLSGWDTSAITDMSEMFSESNFNGNISTWEVSAVTDFRGMFEDNPVFNTDIGNWDVSGALTMSDMFYGAMAFNQDLSDWDMYSVTDFSAMFARADSFNQDLSEWDVSNGVYFNRMFTENNAFNQDIGMWNVSNGLKFDNMFADASAFDQNLGNWDLTEATSMDEMFHANAGLSTSNYDATLIGWATDSSGVPGDGIDDIPSNITFDGGLSTYCNATTERDELINTYGWTIADGGVSDISCVPDEKLFITTWQTTTDNESITIPTNGTGYDYSVDWGDGTVSSHSDPNTDATHTYATSGTYTVKVLGDFPGIYFNNTGDKLKLLSVENWGSIQWSSFNNAFYGCSNMVLNATDAPDLSGVASLYATFSDATNFDADISHWDVSTITDMTVTFRRSGFNHDISNWDVSNVTQLFATFNGATSFNQPLNGWDVSSVVNMTYLFSGATSFNQDLSGWDTSNVTNMSYMFDASNYDQDLGSWDLSANPNMSQMFRNSGMSTVSYDATLIGWATDDSGVADDDIDDIPVNRTFHGGNSTYCQAITARDELINTHGWTISDAGLGCDFTEAFITTWQTTTTNENIVIQTNPIFDYNYVVDWGDGTITAHNESDPSTNAAHTYATPGIYEVKIIGNLPNITLFMTPSADKILSVEQWGSIEWTSFAYAFYGCSNLTITATDSPDLSNVTDMKFIFTYCTNLAGDLSGWDTSSITNMTRAFEESGFNGDITSWDVSNVTNFSSMFKNATAFDQNLGGWDIGNVVEMQAMFTGAGLSTENYDATLIGWATDDSGVAGDGIDDIPYNIAFDGGNSKYCASIAERQLLIDSYGWTITDGGASDISCVPNEDLFITTWQTTTANESITIPTTGTGYNYIVDWGDGTLENGFTGNATHTYSSAGTHTIKITGYFPRIYFYNTGDKNRLLTVEQWGTLEWTSFEYAFWGCSNLVINAVDAPNLTDVVSFFETFRQCTSLAGNLNNWDTSSLETMGRTFYQSNFNGGIGNWDVSNVQVFDQMFDGNAVFNQDISNWNTQSATSFSDMFLEATSFNQDISNWDVSNVSVFGWMFYGATSFDQSLSNWDLGSATIMQDMFFGAGLSTTNYDATLIGWSTDDSGVPGDGIDDIPVNIDFHGGNSTYCQAITERDELINTYGWTIADGGLTLACYAPEDFFITTWQTTTDNESITIPTTGSGYDYVVDWGDGTVTAHSDADPTTDATHTYTTAGTYTVKLIGDFPRIYFNSAGDRDKIRTVVQWGTIEWSSFAYAFSVCSNLTITATDSPDLSNVTSMEYIFDYCTNLAGDLSGWDTSSVTNMTGAFGFSGFNGDITTWDVSNVTNFSSMFETATAFNQDISGWDVSNAIFLTEMLYQAYSFDQNLGTWDLSNAPDMEEMFEHAGVSTANYDATLIGWATDSSGTPRDGIDDIPFNIEFHGGFSTYCQAITERDELINTYGWTITDGGLDCTSYVSVSPKVFLQGAYSNPATTGLMNDDLRSSAMLPLTSPYDATTCAASVFDATGGDAIVDWVWVELRDKNDSSIVLAGQSALLQRDGDVVATDGSSALTFDVGPDSYYVSVNHRNHLGIVTATTVSLSATATLLDMGSDPSQVMGGTLAVMDMGDGVYAMMGGDIDEDGQTNNSDLILLQSQVGNAGYNLNDLDMNGQIQNSDVFLLQPNIGNGQQF